MGTRYDDTYREYNGPTRRDISILVGWKNGDLQNL